MSEVQMSPLERAVLLVLMAEAREMTNAELHAAAGVRLVGTSRVRLNELGLVESTKVGQALVHELTERGSLWCAEELTRPAPARSGSLGGALYAVLAGLRRHLDSTGQVLAEVFQPDVAGQVARKYTELTAGKPEQVRLAVLHAELPHLVPDDFRRAILRLADSEGVHVRAEADRKILTEDDHAAAVMLAGTARHLLTIEGSR